MLQVAAASAGRECIMHHASSGGRGRCWRLMIGDVTSAHCRIVSSAENRGEASTDASFVAAWDACVRYI